MTIDNKVGIGLISFAHVHARGYADQVRDNPDSEIIAIWDEDEDRGLSEARKRGVTHFNQLEGLLNHDAVQGVVVNTPTSMHREVIVAAARAGKHVFTEKSLTITLEDATEVVGELEKAGVKFMISLPSRTRPEILFAKKVLDEGLLGDITLMRARIAHMAALDKWFSGGTSWFGDEEQAGGGAFFDLGCHRVDIMRWFLGAPATVVAQKNNFSNSYDIDDNMVAVVTFHNKAIGIIDVSWVQRLGPNPLEIYGTEGYLSIEGAPNGPRIQLISTKLSAGDISGYIVPTSLPSAEPSPMHQWIAAIKHGTPMTINVHDGWNLTQLLEGCYLAARQGHEHTF